MQDCIFCKIIKGEIPCKKVYEDEDVLAFHDINPSAPIHFLLIPKKHLVSLAEAQPEDTPLWVKCLLWYLSWPRSRAARMVSVS